MAASLASSGRFEALESRQLLSSTPTTTQVALNPHGYGQAAVEAAAGEDGAVYVASIYNSHGKVDVVRMVNGVQDLNYGTNGYAEFSVPKGPSYPPRTINVAVDHANRAVVLYDNALVRLTKTGGLDTGFGTRGTQAVPFVSSTGDVAIDAKNRLVIAGTAKGKTGYRGAIVRLNDRGGIDKSFGDSGAFKTPVPQDATLKVGGEANATNVRILSNGQIVAGESTLYNWTRPVDGGDKVAGARAFRLDANGTLDTKYGDEGYAIDERRSYQDDQRTYTVAAIMNDGSVLFSQNVAHPDFNEPDENSLAYYTSAGKVKRASIVGVPDAIGDQPYLHPTVIGRDLGGGYLMNANGKTYRLQGSFALDTAFTPIAGGIAAATTDFDGDVTLIGSGNAANATITRFVV